MNTYHADEKGYYGEFGGAFIPEIGYPNVAGTTSNVFGVYALRINSNRRLIK